jgi:hypothetical protein
MWINPIIHQAPSGQREKESSPTSAHPKDDHGAQPPVHAAGAALCLSSTLYMSAAEREVTNAKANSASILLVIMKK